MGRFMDLTGRRFGRLTVIERVESDRRDKVIWRCRCNCGAIIQTIAGSLRSGRTQSCSCRQKEISELQTIDITGKKFVRLTVLHRAGKDRHGKLLWRCLCDCGVEKTVLGENLHGGKTRSCGCRGLSPIAPGMRFGRLTVINRAESSSSGDIRYTCLCDCGNIAQPRAYDLRRKDARGTRSCGCLHRERVTRHGDTAHGNISA